MDKAILDTLEHAASAGLEKMDVPGLAIAIIQDGEIVYQNAFGYADIENEMPMTTDHILPMGSSTKSLTAAAVAMLAAEGKLDLDAPLQGILPGFRLHDAYATVHATARDILCHRTGLPRHDFVWIEHEALTRQEILGRMRHLQPSMTFRQGWQYQNMMYAVAGCLVDHVSGMPWEEMIAQRIFQPLGMESASLSVDKCEATGRFPKLYMQDSEGKNAPCPPLKLTGIAPAGGVNATVGDMAKWVCFNMGDGKAGEATLLAEPFFSHLHEPNIPYKLLPFDYDGVVRQGYGLGWFIDSFRGHKLVEHGGNVNGATALLSFLPEQGIGCAIVANATSTHLPKALSYTLYDSFLKTEKDTDWVEVMHGKIQYFRDMQGAAMNAFRASGQKTPMVHTPEEYVGSYVDPGYGSVTITLEGEAGLHIQLGQVKAPLTHLHYDIFYFEIQEMPIPVSVHTGIDGKVCALAIDLEGTLPPIVFNAQPAPQAEG